MDVSCELLELHAFLGKKWTVPMLFHISEEPMSFSKLVEKNNDTINHTLLSNRLKELIRFKLITQDSEKKYSLTPEGDALKKQLLSLKEWATDANYSFPSSCKENCENCDHFGKC